ncbi:predicted protein [Uncinocarpus reesii 1704]|uniref:GED domain-containing protein n=1 Tax=Uncinocarpus reesii (strain UAMH 1704) TaxID=336963 RepID=C4JQC8_UNCRE|nr:uncharacterized protein UREG_04682 [Uncinocarpus reesii 1704]EEP79836.1 predicted protein [Uncinocarpus reesii 1704]
MSSDNDMAMLLILKNKENRAPFGIVDPVSLDKIDKLFACGVGELIDLPQLVVVGDQSSGKSSVLEGLTELPFPRDSGLCTRFATQITFRRSPDTKVTASIIPGRDATEGHRERVRNVMGIGSVEHESKNTFSEDIRLEVSGPDQEHFSVTDIPGIFRKTTPGVTTKADRTMVDRMVREYMENPRSVMLTIIPPNVDIATQDILEWAEEVDPDGLRTLGVLTKPDLVDEGAESAVIDLLDGRSHQLRFGWHVLKNPSQAQLVDQRHSRHELENEFFTSKAPWNRVSRDKAGVHSLRTRLQEIMADHIRREFPKVKLEINRKLKAASKSVEKLGAKRQSFAEQSQFMTKLALEFQRNVTLAIRSEYSYSDIFDKIPSLRLATAAIGRADKVANLMATERHVFHFHSGNQAEVPAPPAPEERDGDAADPEKLKPLLRTAFDVLNEITPDERTRAGLESMLIDQLRNKYAAAISQTEFLLQVELESNPATHNHYFNDILGKCRQERLRTQLVKKAIPNTGFEKVVPWEGIIHNYPPSNADHGAVEIHDILRSYYTVARKRFVDCVRMQVADFLLITGPNTPLSIFSPAFVASMTPEQLEEIAGEDAGLKRRRAQLEKEIKQLMDGKRILT